MARSGRHADGSLGWLPVLAVAGLAAFVVLVASGVVPIHVTAKGGMADRDGSVEAGAQGGRSARVTPDEPSGCKELWGQELRVALAAERTLQEWRLHIDTMDQLQAGAITQRQADALWDASRRGDLHRIRQFERLDSALRRSPSTCDSASADSACANAASAVERTIGAARTAVATWKLHIHEMNLLRAGEITSTEAMQMWQRLWRTGRVQTVRYDHRAAVALGHDCS